MECMYWALDTIVGVKCEEDAPAAEGESDEGRGRRLGRAQKRRGWTRDDFTRRSIKPFRDGHVPLADIRQRVEMGKLNYHLTFRDF